MTQKQKILAALRRKPGATNADLIRMTGSTNPHKRIAELERDGIAVERWQEWWQPKTGRGCWLTHYRAAQDT